MFFLSVAIVGWKAGEILFSYYILSIWIISIPLGLLFSSRNVLAKIRYDSEGLHIQKLFGKKRLYKWKNITRLELRKRYGFARWIFVLRIYCDDEKWYSARTGHGLGKEIIGTWSKAGNLKT